MATCDGMVIVFSGFRDDGLKSQIEAAGGKVATAIGKSTTHVLMKKEGKASKKMAAAHEKGLTELVLDAFVAEHKFALSDKKTRGRPKKASGDGTAEVAASPASSADAPTKVSAKALSIVELLGDIEARLGAKDVDAALRCVAELRVRVEAARASLS